MKKGPTKALHKAKDLSLGLLRILAVWLVAASVLTALHFPYDTDAAVTNPKNSSAEEALQRSSKFYEVAYLDQEEQRGVDYEATARAEAETYRIEDQVRNFVMTHNLAEKRILEVGSGRGYLQDMVPDYTGLDISPSVAHHYHKPFVVGSATDMPFAANSFDAVWSVWVLEHIATPEKALEEMRRVLKHDALLWLYAAWNVPSWTSDGFAVRPYKDFNWKGKIVKASVPIRKSTWYKVSHILPTRAIRWAQYSLSGRTTPLHFRALEPNYETYWESDADAAVSLDSFEAYLWFRSRGDVCLNCRTLVGELRRMPNPLIIRIQKN